MFRGDSTALVAGQQPPPDQDVALTQGLDGDTPIPQPKADAPITGPTKLISTPILGGLHHRYQRVAA